jgi:hypothetical protein
MRTAESKVGAALGAAMLMASVGLVAGAATANAEPTAHKVVYTVTSGAPTGIDIYYLFAQPASKAAFNANSDAYGKRETITLDPGVPWTFETTLEDPQWAIITASGAAHAGTGALHPHCEIAIDGQVVLQQDGDSGAVCQLSQW